MRNLICSSVLALSAVMMAGAQTTPTETTAYEEGNGEDLNVYVSVFTNTNPAHAVNEGFVTAYLVYNNGQYTGPSQQIEVNEAGQANFTLYAAYGSGNYAVHFSYVDSNGPYEPSSGVNNVYANE